MTKSVPLLPDGLRTDNQRACRFGTTDKRRNFRIAGFGRRNEEAPGRRGAQC